MKDIQDYFVVGTTVNVKPIPTEDFFHDFTGTVAGYRGKFVQVRDQNDDVWEVSPEQLSLNTDDIMHGD